MSRLLFGVSILLFALAASYFLFFHEPRVVILESGYSYEKRSPGSGFHLYRFIAEPGWFTHLYLEQKDVDLRMTVYSPSGEELYIQDSENHNHGGELICFIAREQGFHILEIAALDPDEEGAYRLSPSMIREPGSREKTLARAFDSSTRAVRTFESKKAEAYRKSLALFEAALDLWRRAGEPEQEALTLLKMQGLWDRTFRKDRQIECLQQAASIFQSLGKTQTAGLVYHNLGTAFYRSGDFEQAIAYYDRALEFRNQPDRDRADTLNQLALVHLVIGRLKDCEMFLDRARRIYQVLNDRSGLAQIYLQHGRRLSQLERYGRAVETFERALVQVESSDDPIKLAIWNGLGKALTKEKRVDEALGVFGRALEEKILQEEGYSDWKERLRVNMSEALIDRGEHRQALTYLYQGLKRFEEKGEPEERAHVLFNCARAERASGNLDKALTHIETALEIFDELRSKAKSQGNRAHYVSARFFLHDFYLDLLMTLAEEDPGYQRRAFLYLENIRARNLLDALARGATAFDDHNKPELTARVRDLQTRIATLTWEKSRLAITDESSDDEETLRLLRQYDRLLGELAIDQDPTAPSFPEPAISEIQNNLLDEETVLLFFAFGDTHTWLWVVDPFRFETIRLETRQNVEADAREFYKRLKHRDVNRFRARIAEVGSRMTRNLLEPVAERLHGRRLLIIADGALKYIPFGALPSPGEESAPLALRHEIVYLHSMETLAVLRERAASRVPGSYEMVVFAAPAFHAESKFPALPYAVAEARTIAELAPEGARIFQGYRATKAEALGGACTGARILHFATHGLINLDRSELSALVMADTNRKGNPIDGFLRSYEIQGMDLTADLVVLSTCESALGECMRGEGLVGLPQSFLEAGARGVLVSLWEIEDLATRELMAHFYHHLFSAGKGAAAALRHAQSVMRVSERWADPYYWSGFVFLGDWQAFSQ